MGLGIVDVNSEGQVGIGVGEPGVRWADRCRWSSATGSDLEGGMR